MVDRLSQDVSDRALKVPAGVDPLDVRGTHGRRGRASEREGDGPGRPPCLSAVAQDHEMDVIVHDAEQRQRPTRDASQVEDGAPSGLLRRGQGASAIRGVVTCQTFIERPPEELALTDLASWRPT
jgi:hypothetical protein